MGKTNDRKEEAKPRAGAGAGAGAGARTQPLRPDGKFWTPSSGHLEMVIRLASAHWSGVASVESVGSPHPLLHLFTSTELFQGV